MKQSRHVHHPHDQATTVKVLAIGIVLLMAIAFGAWITDSDAGTQATVDRTWAPLPGEVIAPPAGTTLKDPNPADVDPSATKAMENERAFNAPDGSFVHVAVSSYSAPDQVLDQQYVDFLGSLIHGKELDGIQVMIVGPSEIQEDQYCGGDAVACYDPSIGQVFMFHFDLLWFLIPMAIFRPYFERHFVHQLAQQVYINTSRLAAQWEERINRAIEDMRKQAARYIQEEMTTMDVLLSQNPGRTEDIRRLTDALEAAVLRLES